MTLPSRPSALRTPEAPATARFAEMAARVTESTTKLLTSMGMEGTVVCRDRRTADTSELWVEILCKESGLLIGDRGSTLSALEHVLRLLLRPVIGGDVRVVVDVNAYRARREEMLRRRVLTAARRVRMQGRAVVLEPMRPAERRLAHVALADQEGITTESQGEEPNRRVVIRPADPLV